MDPIDYGRFLAALLFVLGLIALTAWLARRFRLGPGAPPGAERRLALVETMPLDARRKLVLIRRDPPRTPAAAQPRGQPADRGRDCGPARSARVSPARGNRMRRPALRLLSTATLVWYFSAGDAAAQSVSVDLGAGGTVTGQLVRLVLLITVLSLAPSILVMITSFTRVVVVLAFLRSALGLQQTRRTRC
jgi:FliP family